MAGAVRWKMELLCSKPPVVKTINWSSASSSAFARVSLRLLAWCFPVLLSVSLICLHACMYSPCERSLSLRFSARAHVALQRFVRHGLSELHLSTWQLRSSCAGSRRRESDFLK